jgi:hypothetical protein
MLCITKKIKIKGEKIMAKGKSVDFDGNGKIGTGDVVKGAIIVIAGAAGLFLGSMAGLVESAEPLGYAIVSVVVLVGQIGGEFVEGMFKK